MTTEERYWLKIDKNGPVHPVLLTACWLWLASKNLCGYGAFRANGAMMRAHRFSFELHKGPIPQGKVVDHMCRNRACQNPDHLRLQTRAESCISGGYGRPGKEIVERKEIAEFCKTHSLREAVKKFNVDPSTVSKAKRALKNGNQECQSNQTNEKIVGLPEAEADQEELLKVTQLTKQALGRQAA